MFCSCTELKYIGSAGLVAWVETVIDQLNSKFICVNFCCCRYIPFLLTNSTSSFFFYRYLSTHSAQLFAVQTTLREGVQHLHLLAGRQRHEGGCAH